VSILTTVPYYRVIRDDEDDRRQHSYDREFENALRWHPGSDFDDDFCPIDVSAINVGQSVLRRLRQGDEVARRHLDHAISYLTDAITYYDKVKWEPYPGRNAEAAADLRALLGLVTP
jgi:hypothetical protein